MWWRGYRDTRLHRDSRDTKVSGWQTDLVKATFHHSASTQNLGLGPGCFYVLQVLLPNLSKNIKKNLKSLRHKMPQSRRNHCDTLFLISRTSFGLVFIGMNWLAAAAWRTPSSFDHCKEHTKESQTDILSETKTSKQKDLLKLCRLHKTKIKNHAELK